MSKLVINVRSGIIQDIFTEDPSIQVILIDWDNDGCRPNDDLNIFPIDAAGGRLARSISYPTNPLHEMPPELEEAAKQSCR